MRIAQVVARKGRCVWRLCATGIEGHAGNAHATSRNAVVELARAVLDTSQLTDYSEDVTVNVGTFAGGIGVNTVPGSAEALVEMRAADGDVFERTAHRIDELMAVSALFAVCCPRHWCGHSCAG